MYYESQGTLCVDTIASVVKATETTLRDASVAKRLSLRATLLLEELLLRYQEQFGEEAKASFSITKRFGTIRLRIEVEGPQFNALEMTAEDDDLGEEYDFITAMLGGEFEPPSYVYRRGRNIVTLTLRVQKQRPIWLSPMFLATVLAVLAFFVVSRLDEGIQTVLVEDLAIPVASMLMGVLSAITGPLLSLTLISGICALGDVSTLKNMGRRAIGRIMVWVVILFVASAVVSAFFYHGAVVRTGAAFDPGELFELLLSSIPSNLFSPFVEGNSMQIAVESIFIGVCLLALGERTTLVKKLIIELNSLMFKMMHIFSEVLPVMIGLSIFKTLMTTDVTGFASMGLIVAINLGITVLVAVGVLLWAQVTLRVSPAIFLKKLSPALFICLTTGSGTSAMSEFFRISKEELGVENKVVDFWVPLGHAMFAPSVIIPLVVGMFAVSSMEGIAFGLSKMAVLFLLVFQLSIACPKVPGGIAATFTILLGQLGLPLDSVGILMAANVFVCNPQVTFGEFIRFAELCSFAKAQGALDEGVLKAGAEG